MTGRNFIVKNAEKFSGRNVKHFSENSLPIPINRKRT